MSATTEPAAPTDPASERSRSRAARLLELLTSTTRRYLLHTRLLVRAAPGLTALAISLTVVTAAASTLMLVATGRFVGALPAAIDGGLGSSAASVAWRWLIVSAVALVTGPLASAAQNAVAQAVSARYLVTTYDMFAEIGTHPYGIAQVLRHRLSASVRAWRAPDVRVGIRNGWLDVATTVLFYAVVIAVLVSMVRGVIGGTIGIPAVVLALVLVTQLQTVGEMVHWAMLNLTRTARTADRFRWLRDYEAQVREVHCGRAEPPPQLRHGIRTENLTYAYPGAESPTLDGLTLDLPAGAVVALVGENGAGKSTPGEPAGGDAPTDRRPGARRRDRPGLD